MDLQRRSLSELHFPQKEWLCLRPAFDGSVVAPDFFLYGVEVGSQVYAWHRTGGAIAAFSNEKLPILILKKNCAELEAFGLYLKTAFTAQPAIDVEWVCAMKVLHDRFEYNASSSGLPAHWDAALAASGLEPSLTALATRTRYNGLSTDECRFLYERRWDLSAFELIETLTPDVRKAFLAAIERAPVSAAQAKECLSYALLLTKKMGEKTALTIISKEFKGGDEFRNALLYTAQPELATMGNQRIEKLRALKAPPRTSVFGDPSFEKEGLKITHNPRNIGDWMSFKFWVAQEDVEQKMRELLEIYQ